jgi:WD40 repeat protein
VNEHYPDDLFSAGYDGMAYLWDIRTGKQIRSWDFSGCQFIDGEISPNGQYIGLSDMQGHYTLLGVKNHGMVDRYTMTPGEQFFVTDYQPLVRDLNESVVDAATQVSIMKKKDVFYIHFSFV